MSYSLEHPNRQAHNWLAYKHQDRSLEQHAHCISGKAFDLGAGSGIYRRWCLERADSYVAVDWPGSMHGGAVDISADLNGDLPIGEAVADSLICFSVLEHLHEPERMLAEAARILRPGGYLLLQVPWQWWIHEEPYDYFRYTPFALKRMLGKAGFEVPNIEAQGGLFTTLGLKLNYFSLRLVKGPEWLRKAIRALLWLPWQLSQLAALVLDRFDWHPELETHAYFVVARRFSGLQLADLDMDSDSSAVEN